MVKPKAQTNFRSMCQMEHLGTIGILEKLCMLLPKVPKVQAIKDPMALVAHSIGSAKCAAIQICADLDTFGLPNLP